MEFLEIFMWSECVMHARIFYDSYNAVAMHRIVICKSSSDKHIDSKCRGWLWQEEMFHWDDRFSFAEHSLAAVLSQHSTGMLVEASSTHLQMGGLSCSFSSRTHRISWLSWGQWLLWKRQSKPPLASWGHHSLWTNAATKVEHAVKAKSFSCCHTAKFVEVTCPAKVESCTALYWTLTWFKGHRVEGMTFPALD